MTQYDPHTLSDIAFECGVIHALYYAGTEIYHIGKSPDVEMTAAQQAAREQIAGLASKLTHTALLKRLDNLKNLLDGRVDVIAEVTVAPTVPSPVPIVDDR